MIQGGVVRERQEYLFINFHYRNTGMRPSDLSLVQIVLFLNLFSLLVSSFCVNLSVLIIPQIVYTYCLRNIWMRPIAQGGYFPVNKNISAQLLYQIPSMVSAQFLPPPFLGVGVGVGGLWDGCPENGYRELGGCIRLWERLFQFISLCVFDTKY